MPDPRGDHGPNPAVQGLLWAGGWVAGAALQLQMAALWPARHVAAIAVAGALALLLALWLARAAPGGRWPRQRSAWAAALLAALACLALGWASTHQRAAWRLADALPPALEGQDLRVVGVVAQMPREGLNGTRFVFEVEQAWHLERPVRIPQRLSLGWYRGFDGQALLSGPPADLRAGQRWAFSVRLKQPHGSLNPFGFDLELWLFEQGIRAGGSVRASARGGAELLAEDAGRWVERTRQAVRDAILARVPDARAAGVLAALVIGDQAAITRDDWDLFRVTGVAHLMSISGLHVTMFAWAAGLAIGWLWRRSQRLMLWLPTPLAARWGGLALAAAYAVLAGWGVPAQRTVWMLAVAALLRSLGLRWPWLLVLGAAGWVVVLADPWALLQPGFWLSFVAVGLLVASEPAGAAARAAATQGDAGADAAPAGIAGRWWPRVWQSVHGGLKSQWVASIGLAPLSMLFFQQLSLVGLLANLVAIPLVTLLVTPLGLLGVLLPPLWWAAAWLVQGLSALLQVLANWPLAVWTAAAAPAWAAACGLLAALLAVAPLPWRWRLASVPLLLPLLWPAVQRPAHGAFELLAADVGQGTAVLVRTQHHLLVADAGPSYSPEADAGGRVLLPLLRARGEAAVHLLLLSHRDTDHVGGAASLMAGVPVQALTSSLEPGHALLQRGLPHTPCTAGQRWRWDGVDFEVLHPLPEALEAEGTELSSDERGAARSDATADGAALRSPVVGVALPAATRPRLRPNALSCVLRVQGRSGSALLTGDIEAAQEAALLQRAGERLRSDVLLMPHHGSRTSSTPAFIDAVAPQVAVAQAAYRSRFGHPAPVVLQRYAERGIDVRRSDRCGAWQWHSEEPPAAGRCERSERRRYWHAVLPAE